MRIRIRFPPPRSSKLPVKHVNCPDCPVLLVPLLADSVSYHCCCSLFVATTIVVVVCLFVVVTAVAVAVALCLLL